MALFPCQYGFLYENLSVFFLGGYESRLAGSKKKYWEPVSRFPISFIGLKNYALHRSLGFAYFYLAFLDNSLNHMIFFKPFLP